MAVRPVPNDLLPWALAALPDSEKCDGTLNTVAGDASNRRYYRLQGAYTSYIVAEAPPATEKNEAFVAVQAILALGGVRVPRIHAVDYERGYLLLEDLGARSLLPELTEDTVDAYYRQAFASLQKLAAIEVDNWSGGFYDHALLSEELGRFSTWFVEALLAYALTDAERQMIVRFEAALIDSALAQPTVLVHRDFHSRNLMLLHDGELALIDFQDAVVGPVSYDLASLLRDCYIRWPANRVRQWASAYLVEMHHAGKLLDVDDTRFLRWFDWMGLQRHIKVLGTFARLTLRDGKSAYLDDLPLVLVYVEEMLEKYGSDEPAFAEFHTWFKSKLTPLIAQQSWRAPRTEGGVA